MKGAAVFFFLCGGGKCAQSLPKQKRKEEAEGIEREKEVFKRKEAWKKVEIVQIGHRLKGKRRLQLLSSAFAPEEDTE